MLKKIYDHLGIGFGSCSTVGPLMNRRASGLKAKVLTRIRLISSTTSFMYVIYKSSLLICLEDALINKFLPLIPI